MKRLSTPLTLDLIAWPSPAAMPPICGKQAYGPRMPPPGAVICSASVPTKARFSRLTNGCALECRVSFRQLRTCRRTRPGQLWAKTRLLQRSRSKRYSMTHLKAVHDINAPATTGSLNRQMAGYCPAAPVGPAGRCE